METANYGCSVDWGVGDIRKSSSSFLENTAEWPELRSVYFFPEAEPRASSMLAKRLTTELQSQSPSCSDQRTREEHWEDASRQKQALQKGEGTQARGKACTAGPSTACEMHVGFMVCRRA